jgi:hypothetical protein
MSRKKRNRLLAPLAACAAISMLAACGASTQIAPAGAASALSWVAPASKSDNLLYVSDLGANSVDIYTYPGGTLVGTLHDFGSVAGLCVDKGGQVFVVDEAGPAVDVYAHGGSSQVGQLKATGAPYGCAVDPTTGNLALTNLSSYLYGTISVYPKAKGNPKELKDSQVNSTYFCGYDDEGNLFIDGNDRTGDNIFLELPKKSGTFKLFKLGANFVKPGGVQWDGTYVAVGDQGAGMIYRMNRSTGTVAHTVTLKSGTTVEQFWISGSTLVGPNAQSDGPVGLWHYPAGGSPTKSLTGFYYPIAAAVSLGTQK